MGMHVGVGCKEVLTPAAALCFLGANTPEVEDPGGKEISDTVVI